MNGYTDENGSYTFTMSKFIEYNISLSNLPDGIDRNSKLVPNDTEYIWNITPTPTPTPVVTQKSSWDLPNNIYYKGGRWVCSFIPIINKAFNC
jgi:hypothetical protein